MTATRHRLHQAIWAVLAMVVFSFTAWVLTPAQRLVDVRGKPDLEVLVPHQFGDWHEEKTSIAAIINPQQEEQLKRIYTQTLSRVYVNSQGKRVMLALAYGEDQRDGMQLHYPEVCYPAQGFQLQSQKQGLIVLDGRSIHVKRLATQLGSSRRESVTYWTLLGEKTFSGSIAKKFAEIRYGLHGFIADGLLFRISSIEPDPVSGFALHEAFARDMMAVVSPAIKDRLIGSS